jgi:predicted O-methyltransferase YrrM
MQCCQFEMVLAYMQLKVAELGTKRRYTRMELADILMDHGITTVDQLPDVVSLARNLETQAGVSLAA